MKAEENLKQLYLLNGKEDSRKPNELVNKKNLPGFQKADEI